MILMIRPVPPIHRHLSYCWNTHVLVAVCSLLLLAPVVNGRMVGPVGSLNSESEEPRQPCEEERSSENLIQHRLHGSRTLQQGSVDRTGTGTRGVTRCRPASRAGLIPPTEHRFRNGVGTPLRC
jgi:hypothetical protein